MKKYIKPELNKITLTAKHQVLSPCKTTNGNNSCFGTDDAGQPCPSKESYGTS